MIEIPLTKGYVAIIDDCDADLAEYNWQTRLARGVPYATRYLWINQKNKQLFMHRVILERMVGRPLTRQDQTDHIHGMTLDNRRSEIRLATYTENSHNTGMRKNNTSGYKGVSYSEYHGKFRAQLQLRNKKIHLGWYITAEEAYVVFCEAAKKYHGEFVRLE